MNKITIKKKRIKKIKKENSKETHKCFMFIFWKVLQIFNIKINFFHINLWHSILKTR